jgi:hypothetical protein
MALAVRATKISDTRFHARVSGVRALTKITNSSRPAMATREKVTITRR